jgi:ferric-dicitrate binding protein FerR (iron transport regulator)
MSTPPIPPKQDEAKLDQARHMNATHMASTMPKKNAWVPSALGALVVAVLVVVAIWRLNKASAGLNVDKELTDPNAAVTNVPEAQRGNLTLDDGTAATLGADTHIIVPAGFNKDVRAVRVVGTGSLKIVPGKKDSFDLRVGKAAIRATDATIEFRADSAHAVVVRIRAGSAIATVGKDSHPLATGESIWIDTTGTMRAATAAEIANGVGWTDGNFVADSEPLSVVVKELQRWYGLILFIDDKTLVDRPVTMSASLDSQDAAIKALEKGGKLAFSYDKTGKNMQLHDAGH